MEQNKGEGFVKFSAGNAVYHFPIRSADDFPWWRPWKMWEAAP